MKIFVTGNSRSGTTMMSRILGNHKDVLAFQELHFFDELLPTDAFNKKPGNEEAVKLFATLCAIQRHGYFGSRDYTLFRDEALFTLNSAGPVSYSDVFEKFLTTETERNQKSIPCEQTPQTIFFLNELLTNYSDVKIIVMVRDPREVLLSQKYKWKRRELSGGQIPLREAIRARINYHPVTISKIWKSVMKTALLYKDHAAVILVKYEDLIQHPDKTIRNICTHCKISFDEFMLDIPVVGSSNFGDSSQKRGVDFTKVQQWKKGGLNATEIAICQQINDELMQQFGYDTKLVQPNSLLLLWYKLSMPFRLGLALLFNLKRLKGLRKIATRFFES